MQQQQVMAAAASESGGRMDMDDLPTQPNKKDVDEQMQTLMNEPFVQSIKDFFSMTLEKFKNDQFKRNEFLQLCKTFDQLDDQSYEDPLKKIFNLVCGMPPLNEQFVELLPETFTQRIFPKIETSHVQRFDQQVKLLTTVDTFDKYIEIVLANFYGKTSTQQFRRQIQELFQDQPVLLEMLPVFFEEIDDETAQAESLQLQQVRAKAAAANAESHHTVAKAANRATIEKPQKTSKMPANRAADEESHLAPPSDKDLLSEQAAQNYQVGGAQTSERKKEVVKPGQAFSTPRPQVTPIPASLQKFPKVDVSFLLDRVSEMLKDRAHMKHFINLFALYLDGILSQSELYDLVQDLVDPSAEEHFRHLQTMISQRDNSRRDMLDVGQFKLTNMLTKSYYIFSDDYVQPVCSGRYKKREHALQVLNDRYSIKTSGTEDYKFKIKNVHEDNLFKNEDEMYAIDHQILQFARVIKKLHDEEQEALKWKKLPGEQKVGPYEPKVLNSQHFQFIKRFYEDVMPDQGSLTQKKVLKIISKAPVELIQNWLQRLETHLNELQQDKADKLSEWKNLCETNFYKSLDHRSFFFKKEQKDLLPQKKQQTELERIAQTPISAKSLNQLKGGSSPEHEFYCTYTSFKINHIQVYTEADLQAPSYLNDYPINLRDQKVIDRNPAVLPHMRFLLNDKKMLEMTFMVLISGPQVGSSITVAEKQKIEDCLEILISKFFRCEHSFKQLKAASKRIQLLSEEEIAVLTKNSTDYYKVKEQEKFQFETWNVDSNEQSESAPKTVQPPATTLQLPFTKDESKDVADGDSNVNGGKAASEQSSSNSSSQESGSAAKRAPSAAELKQLISLQDEKMEAEDLQGDNQEKLQSLLEPAFKEGYSLIYGTMHFYMVFKTIASIYERLRKAQQLITAKVDLDLSKSEIKEVIGAKTESEMAAYRDEVIVERFKLFINALIGTLSQTPHKKLDPSNYEDIVRTLMGEQAYLLFVFDKLIMQTLKNLPILKTSDECQKNLQLFAKFTKQQTPASPPGSSDRPQKEHHYLAQFQKQMQSVNNFNGTSIRLLFSPVSGVLCLHMFSLSPYTGLSVPGTSSTSGQGGSGTQTMATFQKMDSAKMKYIQQTMYKKVSDRSNLDASSSQQENPRDKDSPNSQEDYERLRVPVFLNRNRRKMKQLRKHVLLEQQSCSDDQSNRDQLIIDNGLIMRQVPAIGKLVYDANSSDYMAYKRRRVAPITQEQQAAADFAVQQKFEQVREAQRQLILIQLTSESQVSEERMASEDVDQRKNNSMGNSGTVAAKETSPNVDVVLANADAQKSQDKGDAERIIADSQAESKQSEEKPDVVMATDGDVKKESVQESGGQLNEADKDNSENKPAQK